MTRRRTVLPWLAAMLIGAVSWAIAIPAAYAGGPTSVLMTNPSLGRATALRVENPGYDRLYAAVGEEVPFAEGVFLATNSPVAKPTTMALIKRLLAEAATPPATTPVTSPQRTIR